MILDDIDGMKRTDKSGMLGLVTQFPDMLKDSWASSATFPNRDGAGISNVIFTGMGGSAFGGEIASRLMLGGKVPAAVVRGYDLPGYAGKNTLLVCPSYSGNTEETLSVLSQALDKGCAIACITSGGKMENVCSEKGLDVIKVKKGLPPRAALPVLLSSMLRVLSSYGILKLSDADVFSTAALLSDSLKELGPEVPADRNPAKRLAASLAGRVPVVMGTQPYSDAAAYRWKCQFNENSKMTAVSAVFPELDHNEIVNLAAQSSVSKTHSVIMLRDRFEGARNSKRIEITRSIISRNIGSVHEVGSKGGDPLGSMLYLCLFGDLVSVYLALLSGNDPTPVDAIEDLKKELAKT